MDNNMSESSTHDSKQGEEVLKLPDLTEDEIKFVESFAPVPARLDPGIYINWDIDVLQAMTSFIREEHSIGFPEWLHVSDPAEISVNLLVVSMLMHLANAGSGHYLPPSLLCSNSQDEYISIFMELALMEAHPFMQHLLRQLPNMNVLGRLFKMSGEDRQHMSLIGLKGHGGNRMMFE